MEIFDTFNPAVTNYLIIPLLIFIARIMDVSIGTVRIIMVGKGFRLLSAALGFVEVFIWVLAISQIMQNLNNYLAYLAYAFGFAAGTYLGIVLEQKLSIGNVIVRIITRRNATELLEYLIVRDYNLTTLDAEGRLGDVKLIYMIVNRKKLPELLHIIKRFNPNAFYSIEDVRYVNEPFAMKKPHPRMSRRRSLLKAFSIRK